MKRSVLIMLLVLSVMLCGCNSHSSKDVTSEDVSSSSESVAHSQTEKTDGTTTESTVASSETTSEEKEDENTIYYSWETYRLKYYTSVDELFDVSEVIVTGDCISSKVYYQLAQMYTVSEIRVSNCYKGTVSIGDIIQVVEMGGRDKYGEWQKNCNAEVKDFPTETHPEDINVVIGIDDYYPMKDGDSVLLFLGDTSGFLQEVDGVLYGMMGDTDGKLYLQSDGTYKKPVPSKTDKLVFNNESLSADVDMLERLKEAIDTGKTE